MYTLCIGPKRATFYSLKDIVHDQIAYNCRMHATVTCNAASAVQFAFKDPPKMNGCKEMRLPVYARLLDMH